MNHILTSVGKVMMYESRQKMFNCLYKRAKTLCFAGLEEQLLNIKANEQNEKFVQMERACSIQDLKKLLKKTPLGKRVFVPGQDDLTLDSEQTCHNVQVEFNEVWGENTWDRPTKRGYVRLNKQVKYNNKLETHDDNWSDEDVQSVQSLSSLEEFETQANSLHLKTKTNKNGFPKKGRQKKRDKKSVQKKTVCQQIEVTNDTNVNTWTDLLQRLTKIENEIALEDNGKVNEPSDEDFYDYNQIAMQMSKPGVAGFKFSDENLLLVKQQLSKSDIYSEFRANQLYDEYQKINDEKERRKEVNSVFKTPIVKRLPGQKKQTRGKGAVNIKQLFPIKMLCPQKLQTREQFLVQCADYFWTKKIQVQLSTKLKIEETFVTKRLNNLYDKISTHLDDKMYLVDAKDIWVDLERTLAEQNLQTPDKAMLYKVPSSRGFQGQTNLRQIERDLFSVLQTLVDKRIQQQAKRTLQRYFSYEFSDSSNLQLANQLHNRNYTTKVFDKFTVTFSLLQQTKQSEIDFSDIHYTLAWFREKVQFLERMMATHKLLPNPRSLDVQPTVYTALMKKAEGGFNAFDKVISEFQLMLRFLLIGQLKKRTQLYKETKSLLKLYQEESE